MPFKETERGERWYGGDEKLVCSFKTPQEELESHEGIKKLFFSSTLMKSHPLYTELEDAIKKLEPLIANWPEEKRKLEIEKLEDEISLCHEQGWCRKVEVKRQELKELICN